MDSDCDKEKLWGQGHHFLDSGNEAEACNNFLELVRCGDWRGAYMMGWLSEEKGRESQENYIKSAHWYNRALSLAECSPPHEALARYYYFGLGGYYDYKAAFDHLLKSDQSPVVQIMTAELLAHGLGVERDMERAGELYRNAGKAGYPAAWLGLMSLSRLRKKYFLVAAYFLRSLVSIIKLILKDRNDPRLTGIGGNRGTLRRNWVKAE